MHISPRTISHHLHPVRFDQRPPICHRSLLSNPKADHS
nr:MAG TPA: Transcriptional regulator [Bacteriophage sp.]